MALRAVKAGEKAPAIKPPSVSEAAESGDRLALLVAMRSRIAKAVAAEDCPPRDLAALTRRLDDIAKQIEQIRAAAAQEAKEQASVADEDWSAEAL